MSAIQPQPTAHPFLKWTGGKTVLLPEILRRLPAKIGTYYEPFLGGGAVFFALAAEKRFKHAVLGDANEELILTYEAVARNPGAVIESLKWHAAKHCAKHYYTVRDEQHGRVAPRMIYLNRTCFNGLYRVNRKGGFNVPIGDYKNPTICDDENLLAVSSALSGVDFIAGDFAAIIAKAKKGDVVYFDPPYVPLSPTSNFTSYVKGGFGEAEHVRLRDCFRALDEKGVHVLLSNSDTPLVRKLYKGFRIEAVRAPRRINSKGSKRGDVSELLISGKRRSA